MPIRPAFRVFLGLAIVALAQPFLSAAQGMDFPVAVAVQTAPPAQATFTWGSQSAGSVVQVYRRDLGAAGNATWLLRGSSTLPTKTYVDSGLAAGASYEYKIVHSTGTAYSVVTIDAPLVDSRGAVLLVVDDTVAAELDGPLRQYEIDLAGDGWDVVRMDSTRHGAGTPETLKAAIKAAVVTKPAINSVILFGKLPMVRSGLMAPDGHTPSRAHETDTFYADLDGTWTDTSINVPASGSAENENIPGDGKYDQNNYPTALELAVGRVTFHDMPSFRKGEVEYLRDYLHKAHAWRAGKRSAQYRGFLSDTNNGYYLFTARNWMSPMFGIAGVEFGSLQPATSAGTYIWSVSCDDAGPISGKPVQAIFMESFKSWKQMFWRSDNAIRGMITQPDWGLASVWGARPPWYFHHMAAGRTFGYSGLRTQNNGFNGTEYGPPDYSGMEKYVSNNIQGDPTLRMHPVAMPGAVSVARSGSTATLGWSATTAPALAGYHVYRSTSRLSGYTRLTTTPTAATTYADTIAPAGVVYYQVRAVASTTVLTGSYINQSDGSFAVLKADGSGNRTPVATAAAFTVKSNSPRVVTFGGSDADGDALTPIVLQNPQNGQLRWSAGQAYYISYKDYVGSDSYTFALSDGITVSAPATVAVTIDAAGDTLLGWKAPDGSGSPSTAATFQAVGMQDSSIVFGSGSPRTNPSPYIDQILAKSTNGTALSPTKYLGWTVAPSSGRSQSLKRVTFATYMSTGLALNQVLRVSTDGFVTWSDVPLVSSASTGAKAINTADLSGIAALQSTAASVEFRLYLWHGGGSADATGLGRLTDVGGDGIEDLTVFGTLSDQIPELVTRFYLECFARAPDAGGLASWTAALRSQSQSGAAAAYGFLNSPEFTNRGTSNAEFIDILYRAFFGRAADAGGRNGWIAAMQAGMLREDVIDGFLFAPEFVANCQGYGVVAYTADELQRSRVRAFVRRQYLQCLQREPDAGGILGWTGVLLAGSASGADIIHGFFLSPEFTARGLGDAAFVDILYSALFNRAADPGGRSGWIAALAGGATRLQVIDGFIGSQEFINLCASYGIVATFPPN